MYGYVVAGLYGYVIAGLHGYVVAGLYGYVTVQVGMGLYEYECCRAA